MSDELLAPPVAFHFTVAFDLLPASVDSSFQEVSGIAPEMETETVAEGGENRFVHTLPKAMKPGRLRLKRGVALRSSPLLLWCRGVMEAGLGLPIAPRTVHVYLLDASATPVRHWSFDRAWPVKLEVESFEAQKNQLALETMELAYAGCTRHL